MQVLNHHDWRKAPGFRNFTCKKCGCERNWNGQRYIYTKFSKSYFTVPECNNLTDIQWKEN